MSSNTPRLDLVERNLIINGNMDFCQRWGTLGSATATQFNATNGYVLDRFAAPSSLTTFSVAQVADAPTQTQSGWNGIYSLKATVTSADASPAAGDNVTIRYGVEGYDYQTIHARTVRLQFWVKVTGTNATGTYSVCLRNGAGNRSYTTTYSIPSANTWTQITLDIPLDTTGTWNFDNTTGMFIYWFLLAGTSFQTSTLNTWQAQSALAANTQNNLFNTNGNTFQITQVMLIPQNYSNAGSATVTIPFQRAGRSIAHELQMCQRYYEKSYSVDVAPGTATTLGYFVGNSRVVASASINDYNISYKVSKRIPAAVSFWNANTGAANSLTDHLGATITTFGTDGNGTNSIAVFTNNGSGYTTGQCGYLAGQWAAEADL